MKTYKLEQFKSANGQTRVNVIDMTNARKSAMSDDLVGIRIFSFSIEEVNDADFIEDYIIHEACLSGADAQELYDFIISELNKDEEDCYYVVRDTNHPREDLERNWSGFLGGSLNGELGGKTEEEAKQNYANQIGVEVSEVDLDFKFHSAYSEFVAVDYEGLGAFVLDSESLEDALIEANKYKDNLAVCTESGDGHFFAEDVISYHKVREGRYIFKLK